jgi:hypothetical protein
MKGIKQFFANFNSYEAHCFKHIIDNCKQNTKDCGRKFQSKLAWAMRNADTRDEYLRMLAAVRAQSPAAAEYFNALPHDKVYQYVFNDKKLATHNFKTSQIVECLNGVFVNARHHTPYRLNNMILTWLGKQFFVRAQRINKWIQVEHHRLTPWCHQLFQVQVREHDVCIVCGHPCLKPCGPNLACNPVGPTLHATLRAQPCMHLRAQPYPNHRRRLPNVPVSECCPVDPTAFTMSKIFAQQRVRNTRSISRNLIAART